MRRGQGQEGGQELAWYNDSDNVSLLVTRNVLLEPIFSVTCVWACRTIAWTRTGGGDEHQACNTLAYGGRGGELGRDFAY